jgi:NADH-quinone oxidoreductase subunit N
MAGIPPLSGFFAKYFIFSSAMEAGYIALVIIAILASLIGVYYYFKIIIAMYFKAPDEGVTYNVTTLHKIVMIVVSLAIVLLGIFPDLIMGLL